MSNVEKIVTGIEEYAKDNFEERILNHFMIKRFIKMIENKM